MRPGLALRVSGVAFIAASLGMAGSSLAAHPLNALIQPGAAIGWGTNAKCTQGFVFRDAAGAWYGSTAGHCTVLNERVISIPAGTWFGTVVYDNDDWDFALFRVDADKTAWINPAVRHWGGPTGIATAADTFPGDTLALFGYPAGFGDDYPASAEQQSYAQGRLGLFHAFANGQVRFTAPATPGDSGAPILAYKNGKAAGMLEGLTDLSPTPNSLNQGPSMQAILANLGAAGFALTLQTASFNPIPT